MQEGVLASRGGVPNPTFDLGWDKGRGPLARRREAEAGTAPGGRAAGPHGVDLDLGGQHICHSMLLCVEQPHPRQGGRHRQGGCHGCGKRFVGGTWAPPDLGHPGDHWVGGEEGPLLGCQYWCTNYYGKGYGGGEMIQKKSVTLGPLFPSPNWLERHTYGLGHPCQI